MKGVVTWFLQRISGVVLLAGLTIHFLTMHYSGPEQLTYEAVIERLESPYWKAFNFLFLLAVIYHGFNGLCGIAIEYVRPVRLLRVLQALMILLAFFLVVVGLNILSL